MYLPGIACGELYEDRTQRPDRVKFLAGLAYKINPTVKIELVDLTGLRFAETLIEPCLRGVISTRQQRISQLTEALILCFEL